MSSFKRILFGAVVSLLLSFAAHSDLFENVQDGNWEAVHKTFFKSFEHPATQYQAFLRSNENGLSLYEHIVIHAPSQGDPLFGFYEEIVGLYEQLCIVFQKTPRPQEYNLDSSKLDELEPRASVFGFESVTVFKRASSDLPTKGPTRNPRLINLIKSDELSAATSTFSTTTIPPTPKMSTQTNTASLTPISELKRESSINSARRFFPRRSKSAEEKERNYIIANDMSASTGEGNEPNREKKSGSTELLRKMLGQRSKSVPESANIISSSTDAITETVVNSLGSITIAQPKSEFDPGELAEVDCKQNGDVHLHFQTETENDQIILVPMNPQQLGSGRQGCVYKVKDISGGKPLDIALKIKTGEDPEVVKQFVNEARVLGVIGSLIVYDVCKLNLKPTHLLAMDLIPGEELFKYFYEVKELENGDREYLRLYIDDKYLAAKMIVEVTMAIIWLHDFGYMHRDLKPENILWDKDTRTAKLIDYGYTILATLGDESFAGSWGWKGPERTKKPIGVETHLSDLWGLGNIILHILTRPGRGGNWMGFTDKEVERGAPLDITHLQQAFYDVFSRIVGAERHKTVFDNYQDTVRKHRKRNPQAIFKIEDNPEAANARRNLAYPEVQGLFLVEELTRDDERKRPSSKRIKTYVQKIKDLSWERSFIDLKEIEKKQNELKEPLKKDLLKKIEASENGEASQNDLDDLLKEVKKSVSEMQSKEKNARSRASSETVPKEKSTRLAMPRKSSVSPRHRPKLSPKKDKEQENASEI